ncbi:MAG: glycosyltransferase [Bacteroidetes bacterium]|nr:glycosyltransferase [Bacteroidota bacterium]
MASPLNILFLCSWYPHDGNPTQGIFIRRHAEALALYHRVTTVFASSDPGISQAKIQVSERGNLKEVICLYPKVMSEIPVVSNFIKFNRYASAFSSVIDDLFSKTPFDIIHLHVIFPAGIAALKALQKYKIPLFITEHWSGYYPEDGNYKGYVVKHLTKEVVKRAAAVMVISGKLQKAMQKHGLAGRYHLINNVVDTVCFKPGNTSTAPNDKLRILHVSSLVEREKNILGILAVAAGLKRKSKPFHLLVVGGQPETVGGYKKRVQEMGLTDDVSFAGQAAPEQVALYMRQSDVFLLLSHFEGMPVVLLEAMTCGLPVMSTPVGAVEEMVKPGYGKVLKTHEVSECIQELCDYQRHDYETPANMYRYMEQTYGYAAVAKQITEIYNQGAEC